MVSARAPLPSLLEVYDGTSVTFRVLRALGWGPELLNLGWYAFRGPLLLLNFRPSRTALNGCQKALVAKAIARLAPLAGESVLDVGCGRGYSSFALARQVPGLAVTGVDLLADNIFIAQRLYAQTRGLSYEPGDAQSLPFADESFARVLCLEAAFHFPDKSAFLEQACRVLQPGGRMVLVDFAWAERARADAVPTPARQLVQGTWGFDDFLSIAEYRRAIAGAGFTVVRQEDWTHGVTRPLLAQFRLLTHLARWRLGRAALARANEALSGLSRRDWRDLDKSSRAHAQVHASSRYLCWTLQKK